MIHTLRLLSAALLLSLACGPLAAQTANWNVIPRPAQSQIHAEQSDYVLRPTTKINFDARDKALSSEARFLSQYVKECLGFAPAVAKSPEALSGGIRLSLGLRSDNAEAYTLSVRPDGVEIKGASEAGVFYGLQTLRKALPVTSGSCEAVCLPCVEIKDQPRFAYRGAHFDVSRHFFPVDSVKRFIDMLALHNINRMHWHLTDDQGWRLEIKKYPRLTQVGSQRDETVIGHNSGRYDGKPYGGFYRQSEVKDIVRYAAERHITIVPEIDMPGHMQAALTAYPELGCTGGPYKVWTQWGVSDDVLCAGNDRVLQFIDDVLTEVCRLFPSHYIHVGGDECPKTRWKTCPKCQARVKAEGLEAAGGHSAEERLQSYVIRHASAHLQKLGRNMIGWDEVLEGGLAEGATVMSWRGEAGGIAAAKQNHDVIMTPNSYLYFDYYQSKDTDHEPEAIGGYLPLQTVYSYEPMPESLTPEQQKHIIGVQANLWTEYIPTYRQAEYMELPRMAALCEVQWSPAQTKNYDDFLVRLARLVKLYQRRGYNYRPLDK